MAARSLVVVTAGLSQPSSTRLLADRLASATERFLRQARIEPQLEVIELREFAQDLTNNLLTGFPSPRLRSAIDGVVHTDGLIAVTPIFNASYSGLFCRSRRRAARPVTRSRSSMRWAPCSHI